MQVGGIERIFVLRPILKERRIKQRDFMPARLEHRRMTGDPDGGDTTTPTARAQKENTCHGLLPPHNAICFNQFVFVVDIDRFLLEEERQDVRTGN